MSKILILLAVVLSSMVFGSSNNSRVLLAQNCQTFDENGVCSMSDQVPDADVYMREPAADLELAPSDQDAGYNEGIEQGANEYSE